MIKVATDENGNSQPVVTDKMIKEAQDVVKGQIRLQLKNSMTESRGFAPQSYGGSGGGSGADNGTNNYAGYEVIYSSWTTGNMDKLNAANPDYEFKRVSPTEIEIYKRKGINVNGEIVDQPKKIAKVTNARDLAPYIFGEGGTKGANASYQMFDDQKKAFNAAGKGSKGNNNDPLGLGI